MNLSHKLKISIFAALLITNLTLGQSSMNTQNAGHWKPAGDKITTKWAEEVTPNNAWKQYPRPQMVRKDWKNLNGLWDYAIVSKDSQKPENYDGRILVPFAAESALSGVGKTVGKDNALWYFNTFRVPSGWKGKTVLLHFGAVDWQSTVWVNGQEIGVHKGGYDPFTYDITDALNQSGTQEICVRVWDPTNADNSPQPRGKQVINPGGIFYTAVTGIWQSVWLEPVPKASIEKIKIIPDIDNSCINVTVSARGVDMETHMADKFLIEVQVLEGNKSIAKSIGYLGKNIKIQIDNQKLWSPESPFLYDLKVTLSREGSDIETVGSYFGMRKSSLAKDAKGVNRLFLNNKAVFQFGPLDQGWWPDGLYTAPSDEALKFDIEYTKDVGFNMLRKHVKYEPDRFYYWCDKMGIMVWQDMPSSLYDRAKYNAQELKEIDTQWELEYKRMIDALHNHPSIVMWVVFNEGWGQYDTERLTKWTKEYDPSRLVNNASGWTDRKVGDVMDIHRYPDPGMPALEESRAAVLGEFGGLGWPIAEHVWVESSGNWGYRSHEGKEQYKNDYINLIKKLKPLKENGLAAAVYTQTTDCEVEVNGLMTYDRKIMKLEPEEISTLNNFYLPPSFTKSVSSFLGEISVGIVSDDKDAVIRYTTDLSEPTKDSAEYSKPVKLTKDTTVKAKAFWKNGVESATVSHSYVNYSGKTIAPADVEITDKGLQYELYKGQWQMLPDFSKLTPDDTGTAKKMDLSCTELKENFGLKFSGYINVGQTDVYTFYTDSDDGTKLFVTGQEIVTNDGVHGMQEVSGEIALEAGWHKIELVFFQGTGGVGLNTSYQSAGISKRIIPEDVFGH